MGCLGWVLILGGIIGIFIGGPIGALGIIIGIAILAFASNSNRTTSAVEESVRINEETKNEADKKDLWTAERMNILIQEGLSISDAKIKADMEYTLQKSEKPKIKKRPFLGGINDE